MLWSHDPEIAKVPVTKNEMRRTIYLWPKGPALAGVWGLLFLPQTCQKENIKSDKLIDESPKTAVYISEILGFFWIQRRKYNHDVIFLIKKDIKPYTYFFNMWIYVYT